MQSATSPRVALVSMPWMAPNFPSIQLGTLSGALAQQGIDADVYEFFLDYAATIGLNLYAVFSSRVSFIADWLFARHFFGPETGNWLEGFRTVRPRFGLESAELEDVVLDALLPVTAEFLERMLDATDWSQYDLIGFSLTISQGAASMAMARLIKQRHPEIPIVFGGAECAGVMGQALLRVCPYVDIVVHVEGEPVLPEVARRICARQGLEGIAGISWRAENGDIQTSVSGPLFRRPAGQIPLSYDAYFARLEKLGLRDKVSVWLPFESSRGCWYGEKMQCAFCGLNEIMQFRDWRGDDVLNLLEDLYSRYGVGRFFAVDLILPRLFFETLLPELERRQHDWLLFYEVKANLSHAQVRQLARAGVKWIQPGIESLDLEVLKLMRKGTSPTQNVQLLKWCREHGIRVGWNLIVGLPGERAEAYARMGEHIPRLFHLEPPSGAGPVQLHRFSPYFERPHEFGLTPLGAHPMYRQIYPIPPADLDDLVYLHHYEMSERVHQNLDQTYLEPITALVKEWHNAAARGAALLHQALPDGAAEIRDTRHSATAITHHLTHEENLLYTMLDPAVHESRAAAVFEEAFPKAAQVIGGRNGVERILRQWNDQGLTIADHGHILALALSTAELESSQPAPGNRRGRAQYPTEVVALS